MNNHTNAYLQSLGINPRLVARGGMDNTGYNRFIPVRPADPEGPILYIAGEALTERVEWPEEFVWEAFIDAVRADYLGAEQQHAAGGYVPPPEGGYAAEVRRGEKVYTKEEVQNAHDILEAMREARAGNDGQN